MKTTTKKVLSGILGIALTLINTGMPLLIANAASFSSMSDTMSSQATSATADHTIAWTLATGKTTAVNAVIAIDFVVADIVPSGTWQTSDFAFTDNVRSAAAPAAVGTGAATCSGSSASNYIVNVDATNATFTITTCTGWTTSATATPTTFVIKGATGGTGTLTNKATDVNSSLVTITNSVNDTDSGTIAIVVESNDVVTITATVNPTLTFANDDAAIGFGALSSSAATYANAAATGSGSDTTANTLTIGTNASGGYALTYTGANLTSGLNTIPTANGTTTISGDANGSPGTAEWGMSGVVTGSGSMASGYENGSSNWKFVPSATTTLASHTGPASDSIAMHYLANIAATTPAGSYTTSLTYIATGTF